MYVFLPPRTVIWNKRSCKANSAAIFIFVLTSSACAFPALRERRQDIPLLIAFFMDRMVRTSGQQKMLSDEALKAMLAYDWPGKSASWRMVWNRRMPSPVVR